MLVIYHGCFEAEKCLRNNFTSVPSESVCGLRSEAAETDSD